MSDPPGPRGAPAALANLISWKKYGISFLARIIAEYGDTSLLSLGDYPIYLIHRPSLIQEVLVDRYRSLRKPESLKVSNRGYFGDGLTSLDGSPWLRRKQMMQPAFHRAQISTWIPAIVDCTREMLARWRPKTEVCLYDELVDLRAAIAAKTVLGTQVQAPNLHPTPDTLPLDEARGETFVLTEKNGQFPFIGMRRPRAAARIDTLLQIIDTGLNAPNTQFNMLSYLNQTTDDQGQGLRPSEIKDELLQMFFAGHLTVTSWLTRLWYVLSMYPDIDHHVYRESKEVLEQAPLSFEDVSRLKYITQVVKETGRYFAPAPIIYREIDQPLMVANYQLHRGAGLWICPQLLHHDPRYFAQPDAFLPQRFHPENGHDIPKFAYLPFGAGPRVCIGKAAALMEMQLVVALVAQRYRLVSVTSDASSRLFAMPTPSQLRVRIENRQ